MNAPKRDKHSARSILTHLGRILMIALVAFLIHRQHLRRTHQQSAEFDSAPKLSAVQRLFPVAASVGPFDAELRRWPVLDIRNQVAGYVLQSSPEGDRSIGFSGPTNLLIGLNSANQIVGVTILSSGDTHDHIRAVERDDRFLSAFNDLTPQELRTADVDAVSGATLSSEAIRGAILLRLTGSTPAPRFAAPIPIADAKQLFPAGATSKQDSHAARLTIFDREGNQIGQVIRTSPAADQITGYGGPTEALIGLDPDGKVQGIALGKDYLSTFDNEPYVSYVREDPYFRDVFNGHSVTELSALDLSDAEIDGVSGATMTSMAVAEGIVAAAAAEVRREKSLARAASEKRSSTISTSLTVALIVAALAWKRLPQHWHKLARVALLLAAIAYLGLWRGELVSQAMLVGWAQNGIPLTSATSFVLLTGAAFLLPAAKGNNVYCHQLCPHGALQQLIRNRIPWQIRIGRRLGVCLKLIPPLLLVACLVVAMQNLPFSLVNLEPFDAWLFPVAATASIVIAIVGLAASVVTPMAYCRYGCPTGALLESVRYRRHSGRKLLGDWLPATLLAIAAVLSSL